MTLTYTNSEQLFIGIDGGGSKCKAVIYAGNKILGEGLSGRANPLHGIQQTFTSMTQAVQLAAVNAELPTEALSQTIAGVGLAGVNLNKLKQQVEAWQHPFAQMFVTTDLHTACIGAHQGGDGAVIITGTGSCGYAHVGDKNLLIGGHGFGLGDKGSGAWLGQQAAAKALLALDGLAAETELCQLLFDYFEVSDAMGIVENLAGETSSHYAKLARYVLQAANDDEVANNIVTEGASYINDMARQLLSLNPPRFSMIGGLAEPLKPWLADDVIKQLKPAINSPEMGAVYYAQQQLLN
ncbi:N-acetylglucosamine kinase [Shewanella marina]|uniref:N-acetylglucosamine kinase n=1 Tax=Shewanella marina TaxID=487319 RepID=UPI000471CDE4|nr:BadF/BadG/BcrA/BcrD ATPase family protein [Shewanella marina]